MCYKIGCGPTYAECRMVQALRPDIWEWKMSDPKFRKLFAKLEAEALGLDVNTSKPKQPRRREVPVADAVRGYTAAQSHYEGRMRNCA